jgi:Tol biopolymer transport system component
MPRGILLVLALPSLLTACVAVVDAPLPASVYYLDGRAEEPQVWRLGADGVTTEQMTDEAGEWMTSAVSPADGSLALITDNRLFLQDGDGKDRRLVADASQVDITSEDYVFRGLVESPVFSPDGRTLAYAFDGLHLYNLASGEDAHVLTNLGNLLGEPFVFTKETYYPGSWSPDGSMLLISMGYFEGSTLAVMEAGAEPPFRRLRSDGPACCFFSWSADGQSIFVANPSFGVEWPGLWEFDAETGEESVLVATVPGSEHYVGWPVQIPGGDLIYFHGEHFSPEAGIPLVMVRSRADGSERTQLRPEQFRIAEALWAPDGSLAVILQVSDDGGRQVVLTRTDGDPLNVLIEGERIWGLTWGP